nr:methyltransferase, FxLD system [Kibdelosporangium phytohabitans]
MREDMILKIKEAGYSLRADVEQALRSVERHVFVPGSSLEEAYANDIVVTKRGPDDQVLSCLSQPSIVALQLEQLEVRRGHRVMEIGAGAGYNAALLARQAGPGGFVTTIDVDADIVESASDRLATAGVGNVQVVLGDGALGYRPNGPYDRIVATVGAFGIPDAWLAQLTPTGRLVVPLRLRGSVSRSIAFERCAEGVWRSVDHRMCGFVPLRNGVADDPRRVIPVTADRTVLLQLYQEHTMDPAGVVGVLDRPRSEVWTGVTYRPRESLEWLYLWLACVLDTSLCLLRVDPAAVDSGLVSPMFAQTTMAIPGPGGLAYLTWRLVDRTEDGGKIMEVGVVGHGVAGAELSGRVAEEIHAWSERYRHCTVQFEIPSAGTGASNRCSGRFFLDRPHRSLIAIWR